MTEKENRPNYGGNGENYYDGDNSAPENPNMLVARFRGEVAAKLKALEGRTEWEREDFLGVIA
ncbi:MAG: hypothetical protein NTW17_03630 [Candidatus Pacearchaeota archaeon]|nr:hypothetical protein [Candidatus Pacearchaeota archaeon]